MVLTTCPQHRSRFTQQFASMLHTAARSLLVLEKVPYQVHDGLLAIAARLSLLCFHVEADGDALAGAANTEATFFRPAPEDDCDLLTLHLEVLLANQGVLFAAQPTAALVRALDTVRHDLPQDVGLVNPMLLKLVVVDLDLPVLWFRKDVLPLVSHIRLAGRTVNDCIRFACNKTSIAVALVDEPLLDGTIPGLVLAHVCGSAIPRG